MSCPDLHRLIQDRLDGTLPDAETRLLESHLADCATCRDEDERLRELVSSLGSLPPGEGPARDLWTGLRARLEASSAPAPRPKPSHIPWLRLAAAGLLLALILGSQAFLGGEATPDTKALADEHAEVFAEYERASAALVKSLEARRDDLSSATLDTIDSNLALIEDALTRTREALQASPSDSDLIQFHYALLGRKASVLRDLVQLPSDRSVSTDDDR